MVSAITKSGKFPAGIYPEIYEGAGFLENYDTWVHAKWLRIL